MWTRLLLGGLGFGLLLAIAALLLNRYGAARERSGQLAERTAWQGVAAKAERITLNAAIALEQRRADAQSVHSERVIALQPIVQRSTEKVVQYAATPAGQRPCLAADRVLGIEQDRAALFAGYSIAAPGGAGALLAHPAFHGFEWRLDGSRFGTGDPAGGP